MGLKAISADFTGAARHDGPHEEGITEKRPEKSLTTFHNRSGGRNNDGRMTIRFRGSGHKRLYRTIDFRRDKVGISARVDGH